jgi:P-loop Domain of unknown function (DUF2791)
MLNQVVIHPKYGRGLVTKARDNRTILYVRFNNEIGTCALRPDEVIFCDLQDQQTHQHTKPPINIQQEERLKPRRMIEAFRYGIVPEDCVRDYTFGREKEIERVAQWLNDPEESGLLVVGQYGSGKTHFLNYIRSLALEHRFAVSTAQVSPLDSPFSRPKRLYSQLVQSLRVKTSEEDLELGDFKWLLKKAFDTDILDRHRYFKCVKSHLNYESVWQWIEAKEDHPRPYGNPQQFKDFPALYGNNGKSANQYCYLLSSIGWLTQSQPIASKGLLLILDEAEALYASQSQVSSERSYNFLEALLATARGDQHLLKDPSKSKFDYSAHTRDVPFLYKQPSGLKVLLTFTDDTYYNYRGGNIRSRLLLRPLQADALNQVFDKVCSLYSSVYNVDRQSLRCDEVRDFVVSNDGSTRQIVKSYVEALDIIRFNPDANLSDVLQ